MHAAHPRCNLVRWRTGPGRLPARGNPEVNVRTLALLLLIACNNPPPPVVPGALDMPGDVLLTVNGKPITQQYIDAIASNIPEKQLEMMKASGRYKDFVEQMALGQVMWENALEKGLDKDPKVQIKLAVAQRDALAKELIAQVAEGAKSDEAVQALYAERTAFYQKPQIRVYQILVKSQEEADAIVAEIKGGAEFSKIATERSADRGSAQRGGEVGWIAQGQMMKEVSDLAFTLEINEIGGPVQSRAGYHIVKVTEKRDAIPLEDVKDQLEKMVQQKAVEAKLNEIKESAKIEWKGEPPGPSEPEGAPQVINLDGAPPAPPAEAGH